MIKTIIQVVMVCAACVMTIPAFASAGAPEPGAGCEAVTGDAFGRVQGPPYNGTANLSWNGVEGRFIGTVTQFGNPDDMITLLDSKIPGVNSLEDFQMITAQAMRGFCIINVEGGPSDFVEVQAARQLNFVGEAAATVEVIVVPLIQQQ